jgi:hypothetical protein
MKLRKLLVPALLVGLALLLNAADAWAARQITLQNASSRKIDVALVLPSNRGWWVTAWYNIAPWSTRRINIGWAGGNAFGYYAHVPGQNISWSGKGNAPAVFLTTGRQSHAARQRSNGRAHKVIMKNGSSARFTWKGDRGGVSRAAVGGGGWW